MKKGFIKMLAIIISTVLLAGCVNNKKENQTSAALNEEGNVYHDTRLSLDVLYTDVIVNDTMIYGCYLENSSLFVEMKDKKSGEKKQIEIPMDIQDIYIQCMEADLEENLYILVGNYENNEVNYWKINSAGEYFSLEGISLDDTDEVTQCTAQKVQTDSSGNLYIWYEMILPLSAVKKDIAEEDKNVYVLDNRIYVIDPQLNTLCYISVKDMESFAVGEDDKAVIVIRDAGRLYIKELDLMTASLSEEEIALPKDASAAGEFAGWFTAISNGFLYCQDGNLYEYSYDRKDSKKVLSLSSHGISESNIIYLGISDDNIEIVENYPLSLSTDLVTFSKDQNNKIQLTLGVVQNTQGIEKAVTDFNRYNQDIRVEIVSYYNEQEDYEKSVERLKLDIVTGTAPDIIDVSSVDYEMFVNKGIFTDLYKYLKEDAELNADMLVPSLLKIQEINGQLYSIDTCFNIFSMWGKSSVIGEQTGVSFDELMKILQEHGKGLDAIYGFSADEPILTTLCTLGMDEFIDWEQGSCNFTSEYFKDLLLFARDYAESLQLQETTFSRRIREEDIIMSIGFIFSTADIQMEKEMYGDELTFIGYPTDQGSGTAIGYMGNELAINANGQNQDAAWEFVKYYVLYGYEGRGFPVVQSRLDEVLQSAMIEDTVTSVEGTEIIPKATYADDDATYSVYAAEQDDINIVYKLIESADRRYKYKVEILNILTEEAAAFLLYQKSVEDTAEIIQNRVQLFLDEQR